MCRDPSGGDLVKGVGMDGNEHISAPVIGQRHPAPQGDRLVFFSRHSNIEPGKKKLIAEEKRNDEV